MGQHDIMSPITMLAPENEALRPVSDVRILANALAGVSFFLIIPPGTKTCL
jgi:hypothetical protein